MAHEHPIPAGRHRSAEQTTVLRQHPVEAATGIVVGQQAVGHRHAVDTERRLGRIAGTEHRARKNGLFDRDAKFRDATPECRSLVATGSGDVALALTFATVRIARLPGRVGVADEHDRAAPSQAIDECGAGGGIDARRAVGFLGGCVRRDQEAQYHQDERDQLAHGFDLQRDSSRIETSESLSLTSIAQTGNSPPDSEIDT
jgi:hypothetical protein